MNAVNSIDLIEVQETHDYASFEELAVTEPRFSLYVDTFKKVDRSLESILNILKKYQSCSVGFSSGKDSSVVAVLMVMAVKIAKEKGIPLNESYIVSSSTTIENPAIENLLLLRHREIQAYVDKYKLPITLKIVQPSLANQFVVTTIGRGKLPRFVNNSSRDCSIDWKVKPQQKFLKSLKNGHRIVQLIGTRFDESPIRNAKMKERGETSTNVVLKNGYLTATPIADFTLEDIWLFLAQSKTGRPLASFAANFDRTLDLYRDANEGTCAVITGDKGNAGACGSRFGCSFCTLTGEKDKSMESMLAADDKYSHLAGLNQFRNYLVKTQWDWSKRETIGRTESEAGYYNLSPNNYSIVMRRRLLSYLLTLDAIEKERAEKLEGDILTGKVEDTDENRLLTEPQFELINEEQLMAIEFLWSINGDETRAFSASELWYRIHELGQRYEIPDIETVERTPIPESVWYKPKHSVYDDHLKVNGLYNPHMESYWETQCIPSKSQYRDNGTGEIRKTVPFMTSDTLTINKRKAVEFLTLWLPDNFATIQNFPGDETPKVLLANGIVKIARGKIGMYDEMLRRNQFWNQLQAKFNVTELSEHLRQFSISDKAHSEKLKELSNETGSNSKNGLDFMLKAIA